MAKKLIDSLNYEPVELGFGTSGLRGLVSEMTDLECYVNATGFLEYLLAEGLPVGSPVYIAGDLRDSTPRITAVIVKAVADMGLEAVYCGLIPTPAVAYSARENRAPCIMVTGSHIPADRNGIKFYKPDGEVLKEDEGPIKKHVAALRAFVYETDLTESDFTTEGMLMQAAALPPLNPEAETVFMRRYAGFSVRPLQGKHIVVYQHSAVGRDMLCAILEKMGARVTPAGRSDTFVSIDTENVTPDNKQYFHALAKKYPDNFAIVSTDGDSDRPFIIDERGEFHRGDVVGCLVAKELGMNFVAVPISSNDAVDEFCKQNDIAIVHTKIGSPYVIRAMQAAESNYTRVSGWEVNGGFLLGTEAEFVGVSLRSLPTRDAFLPILVVLLSAAGKGAAISALFQSLPQRYTGGGLIDNVAIEKIKRFKELCEDKAAIAAVLEKAFQDTDLADVKQIDLTDGLRLMLGSGDVLHLRPSGNAPQFRVYTNASSQAAADRLAEKAITPNGYIEVLLGAV